MCNLSTQQKRERQQRHNRSCLTMAFSELETSVHRYSTVAPGAPDRQAVLARLKQAIEMLGDLLVQIDEDDGQDLAALIDGMPLDDSQRQLLDAALTFIGAEADANPTAKVEAFSELVIGHRDRHAKLLRQAMAGKSGTGSTWGNPRPASGTRR